MAVSDRPSAITRLHSLDATRGIAALAVVLWHWQHVYLIGGGKLADKTIQPFYGVLFPFYQAGWLAVEFFFTLSGFVFFWLYGQAIADKTVGLRSFFVARFSRLYPLHLVTLLIILALQLLLMSNGFQGFVYGGTNLPNFIWNLLFLQYFSYTWSYNGPEWSVGVEILLYALFFLYCRVFRPNWILPLLGLVFFGFVMMTVVDLPTHDWAGGRGVIGFFAGGIVYQTWRALRDRPVGLRLATPLFWFIVALWVLAVVDLKFHPITDWLNSRGLMGWLVMEMAFRLALVPLTVFALALYESSGATWWQKVSPLGDLTYSLYLWHFPLQLLIAVCVTLLGLPVAPIQTPLGLLGFMAALIGISILSYRFIERPAQSWLRGKLGKKKVAAAATA